MGVRERILTIRLMEKISANPVLAEAFVQAADDSGSEGADSDRHPIGMKRRFDHAL